MTAAHQPDTPLADILNATTCVLLDFDGPVCSVFAGLSAPTIAAEVVERLREHGREVPADSTDTHDPLDLIEYVARHVPELAADVEAYVAGRERDAITSAAPTPGADTFLRAVQDSGRLLAIVSNNAHQAVADYLHNHDLAGYVDDIAARQPADAAHLKPDPRLLLRATENMRTPLSGCVLIGDSHTDIQAAHTIGIPAIGYANKPGKHQRLTHAGADAVVTRMDEITGSL